MDALADELKRPREGLSTLSAQFTRRYMEKVVAAVRELRDSGMSEVRIFEKMRAELKHVDEHTMRRLYDKSLNKTVPDDLVADQVASRQEIKPGTLELEMKSLTLPLTLGSIVQYEGIDWVVTQRRGLALSLKAIR